MMESSNLMKSMNAQRKLTHSIVLAGPPNETNMKHDTSSTENDSCSIVAFEMQDFSNSNVSEGPSLKVITLPDFIPTVCEDGSYQTVLVSEPNSSLIKTNQTVSEESQILVLATEPLLNNLGQEGLPNETISEKNLDSEKYFGFCRICANGTHDGLPLFHNQGLTFEIVEKIHRCLPIKVSINDGFPQQVCHDCVSKLDVADDLFKLSIEGNAKLQTMSINWTQPLAKGEIISKDMPKEHPKEYLEGNGTLPRDTPQTAEMIPQQSAEMCQNTAMILEANAELASGFEIIIKEEPIVELEPLESTVEGDEGNTNNLQQVQVITHEKTMWHCNKCDFVASKESTLKHHQESKHIDLADDGIKEGVPQEESFSCEYCDKIFQTKIRWKNHVLSHTKSVMLQKDTSGKCTDCGEEFSSAKELQRHLKSVHNVKPDRKYDCDICGRSYGNASGLSIHQATHSKETPYLCDICGKSFKHRANLRCHRRSHGTEKETHRHACDICPKTFPSKFHLSEHKNVHLNVTPYSCTICDKKFHRRIQLRQHKTVHNSNSAFVCPQCGAGFNRRGNMTQHMKLHSKERKFSCKVCKKSFDTLSEVVQHRREHTAQELKDNSEEKEKFSCCQCPKVFATAKALEEHTKTHSTTSFECELCNKQLSNRRTLEYHIRSFHTQERPFPCQFCSMSFLSREACTVHERLHTGEKPFTCPECNMSFRCSSNLGQHLKTHKDERPWACDQCPKRFKRNGILLVHMRTHTGEKPFCCDICGRRFSQKNDMLKHQQTHSAANQSFVCSECHWSFHTRKELNKHRRTHHIISRANNTTSCEPILPAQTQTLVISDNLVNYPITILDGSDVVVHQIEELEDAQILEIDPMLQGVVSNSQILTIQSTSESAEPQFSNDSTVTIIPPCAQQNW